MYKIPANTLFLGKSLVYVPQCHSTNSLASDLSQKPETPEGTIVVTDDQTSGKGQRGSTWVTARGLNLTFSLILRPRFVAPLEQFRINQVVSLAVADFVRTLAGGLTVSIKWPNDIMIGDLKTAGILIENSISAASIQASIVGIGLNINQEFFPWPKATSIKVATGQSFDLNESLAALLGYLEAHYLDLKQGNTQKLNTLYHRNLYWLGSEHRYRSGGEEWTGTISGIDEVGRLRVQTGSGERKFDIKEIEFL